MRRSGGSGKYNCLYSPVIVADREVGMNQDVAYGSRLSSWCGEKALGMGEISNRTLPDTKGLSGFRNTSSWLHVIRGGRNVRRSKEITAGDSPILDQALIHGMELV